MIRSSVRLLLPFLHNNQHLVYFLVLDVKIIFIILLST